MKVRRKVVSMIIGILLVCLGAAAVVLYLYDREEYLYGRTGSVFYNPCMGFAVNADYPDAVQENTLVYIDITWREWEPEEGSYAIESVESENFWERWQEEGKRAVLRFVCDEPSGEAHRDIPDWLYEKTGDGVSYDLAYGKGYAPDYNNRVFIDAHRKAIEALGEAFGRDSMVAYVELGSLGHWGEWHTLYTEGVPRMPSEEIRRAYVEPYTQAFPNARLLARRPFAETAQLKCGLYNDMTGEPEDTGKWLAWIAQGGTYSHPEKEEQLTPQPEVWRYAPIGGEFTSSLSFDNMLKEELETTIGLLAQSHTTFIGPKCPILDETVQYQTGVEEVLQTIGYRYAVSGCLIETWKGSDKGTVTLTIENYGVAPIYFPWSMYLYAEDGDGIRQARIKLTVELTALSGGEKTEAVVKDIPAGREYAYSVAIENPETQRAEVYLDMDCENTDRVYYLKKK